MRIRQYTVDVIRTQVQTVTFLVNEDRKPGDLDAVAQGYTLQDDWSEPEYRTGNLTSDAFKVEVMGLE